MKTNRIYLRRWLTAVQVLVALASISLAADDWPQWLGPQRDGVWRETGILEKFPAAGPKVRWRVAVGGGYAGPAVAKGRVYLTDRQLAPGASNPSNPFAQVTIPGSDASFAWTKPTGELFGNTNMTAPTR